MSRENVALVRQILPLLGSELTTLIRDDSAWAALRDGIERFFEPRCGFAWVAWGQRFAYTGLDGLREGWLEWFEPWTSYRSETEDVIDAGDRVVVLVRDRARRAESDAEVELLGAGICSVSGGKLTQIDFYASRAEALEAAGLKEQDAHRDAS
jgi:hypothetical protein